MNKKILIGSMLVFTMLLLMPSIPAIQMNTIKDRTYNNLDEQFDVRNIKELENILNMKYPRLYDLVIWWLIDIRFKQASRNWNIALYLFEQNLPRLSLLCLIRAMFILTMFDIHVNLWVTLSNTLGWDWNWDIT